MVVTCAKCSTRFKIADDRIAAGGVKVRCSKCKHTFVITPDGVVERGGSSKAASAPNGSATLPPHPHPPGPSPDLPSFASPDGKGAPTRDVFSVPTRVGPASSALEGVEFPVPPPPLPSMEDPSALPDPPTLAGPAPTQSASPVDTHSVPSALPPNVVAGIDLDSDLPIMDAEQLPASIDGPLASAQAPTTASVQEVMGEDLFDDLDAAVDERFAPVEAPAPGPAAFGIGSPTPSPDDPFADIDVDVAPDPADQPAQDDVFAALDDPFAGLDTARAQTAPVGSSEDPFADDKAAEAGAEGERFGPESTARVPSATQMDPMVGHDPFAALDIAPGGAAQDAPGEIGLQLDDEGQITGREASRPAPTQALGPSQSAAPARASSGHGRPAGLAPMAVGPTHVGPTRKAGEPPGTSSVYKIGFGAALVVVALFVFIVYRSGGKPDLTEWSTYVEAFTGRGTDEKTAAGLRVVDVSSTTYPNRDGHRMVILWGEVENAAGEDKSTVVVTGQLLGQRDEILEEMTTPAGVTFGPDEVYAMVDPQAVGDAYRQHFSTGAGAKIAAGEKLPFMVVMFDHPSRMAQLRIRVIPAQSDRPLAGLPSPAKQAKIAPGEQATAGQPDGQEGLTTKRSGTSVRLKAPDGVPSRKKNQRAAAKTAKAR